MISRKKELLTLMNIDTSWLKTKNNTNYDLQSFSQLQLEANNCQKCQLANGRNNVVFGEGNEKADILIIGEAPGKEEDLIGEPFIGRAGKLLTEILFSINLSRNDVYITNTVKCRPPENRNPNSTEISSCAHFLDKQISLISPKVIILLGKIAAERILNTSEPMAKLRSNIHYYKETNIPTLVFYHPAYLLRSPSEKKKVWDDILFMRENINVC
ncbi:MAG: uracil-DNA glycosylase [Gammaproteobacteria bacterium]|nr:uracil-DNA glycosylase [Gammaproteobacteria bacterium]